MACPYFFPTKRLAEAAWPKHPRLPLGDPYTGICRADPMHEQMPPVETLRECCNVGRANGRCSHFPKKHRGPDAFRYSVAEDTADLIRIFYVAERAHGTAEHGSIEYETATGLFRDGPSETLEKQARAYLESYLRRKTEPDEKSHSPHRR